MVLSLSLGACQNRPLTADRDNPDGDPETVDPRGALVVYWHSLTGADEDSLLELIDDFNANNAWGITVVGEYQGDLENLYDRVQTGLITGKLPNLIMTNPSLAAAYADQDTAVALAPYLESKTWGFTQAEIDDFFPSALDSERLPQFGNEQFSFPGCRSLQVLYYNVDWLKELDYEAPPQTWDEFGEVVCAASEPVAGLFGYEMEMDSLAFISMLASQETATLNEDATAYTLGDTDGQATLQFLQDLIKTGCALWETEEGPLSDFGAGMVLFTIGSTADLTAYSRAIAEGANFDWSFSLLPHTTKEPVAGVEGTSLSILRGTPRDQLAAWLFIKWLAEPEQQARWSQITGCYPTRRSAFDAMEDYLAEHARYSLASQFLESDWITEPRVEAYASCRAEIGRMLYAVTAGESVEQWLTDTQNRCNLTLLDAEE
jgi:multiple sugar transport system substrate-binding protein/sn-glycerol 3-phosphate transport system substrate-binding protein